MKKETKELIKWAMSLIADYRAQNMASHTNFRAQNVPAASYWKLEADKCKQFAEFLNSLPEIESHLCRGGYILDKNATPCGHNDDIRCVLIECPEDDWFYGKLVWNSALGSFQILTHTKTYTCSDMSWFEKIEREEAKC